MAQVQEADGFKVGERVWFSPDIDGIGPKNQAGIIDQIQEGRWGNYAKVIPESGNVVFFTKRTDRLEHCRASKP
jgi:hypothetical protein